MPSAIRHWIAKRLEEQLLPQFADWTGQFSHMEIEVPRIDMQPGDLREWLLNIMYYLLENGPVLERGQTIGMSAEQQIRISHGPSSFGHPGKVIRLEP